MQHSCSIAYQDPQKTSPFTAIPDESSGTKQCKLSAANLPGSSTAYHDEISTLAGMTLNGSGSPKTLLSRACHEIS